MRKTLRSRARSLPVRLAGALVAVGLTACERGPIAAAGSAGVELAAAHDSEQSFGEVPDFRLVRQDGRELARRDLLGKPYVAAAVFTTCSGPCPRITAAMRQLQDRLVGTDVQLVSISVDPERDTPELLRSYAESWTADPETWHFLTGEVEDVYRLVRDGLWLAVQQSPDAPLGEQVTHKTSLVAVDRAGLRRGWYDGEDPEQVEALVRRMRFLAEE